MSDSPETNARHGNMKKWDLWERSRRNQLLTKYIEKVLFGASSYGLVKELINWNNTNDHSTQGVVLVMVFAAWLPVAWLKARATAALERLEQDGSIKRTFPK